MAVNNDWQTLKSIFSAALELPPEAREAYLNSLDQSEDVVAEVRALLANNDDDDELLSPLYSGDPDQAIETPKVRDLEGAEIADYVVRHRIGQGGMGAVYLAERTSEGVTQQLALKVIQKGLVDDSTIERFQRERLILARLDHPSVCRLIDTGVTDDGRPYFVMPYLEGARNIVDYVEQAGLDIAARVDLFARVCDAVHYAHQNLVVHSDLKPENILILPSGHIQLLDFGVARLLTPDQAELTQQLGWQRPITPSYASPEQLDGQSPTTASDVYALGVLLFEVLTGEKPYAVPTDQPVRTWPEAMRLPNRSHVSGDLPADLYTICSKAMRAEVNQRYGSAMALSEDLERWRSGHPVLARAPSMGYQLSRFLFRNTWQVAAASIATVSVIALASVITLNALEQARQAEAIAIERDRAEATAQFWADLVEQTDPANAQQSSDSVDDLLNTALERLKGDEDLPPLARIRLLNVISTSWWHRAQPEQALEAAKLATVAADELDAQPEAQTIAFRQLANIHGSRAELSDARTAVDSALAALAQMDDPSPALQAQVLDAEALILDMEGQTEAAADRLEQVVELQRALADDSIRVDHATALGNLAYMYYRLASSGQGSSDKLERAASLVNESIDLLQDEFGPRHPRVAFMLNAAGVIHRQDGDLEASVQAFEQAEDIADSYLPAGHEMLTHLRQNVGSVRNQLGQYESAAAAYRKAYELAELPDGHPDIVQPFIRLMHNLFLSGSVDEAKPILDDMRRHLDALPEDHSAQLWWQVMNHLTEYPTVKPGGSLHQDWQRQAQALEDAELLAVLSALDNS